MYNDNGIWKWRYRATAPRETGYEAIIDSLNIISINDFIALSSEQKDVYVREVIRRIRTVNIYPIYYYSDVGVYEEILRCIYSDVADFTDTLYENGVAGKTLLDFMFPNFHRVEAGNSLHNDTYGRFYDDAKLAKCIKRHMANYRFSSLRTPFFMYGRYYWNSAVNFSPMRAKAIYTHFCPKDSVLYDFSAGFGGRMLGALSCVSNNYTYICCEPDTNTCYNLHRLGKYIENVTQRHDSYRIIQQGSEDTVLDAESIDFAFSCPPYFGLERYCGEATQSYVKYPVYTAWLKYYVLPTLRNIYAALKPDRYCCIVLAQRILVKRRWYDLGNDWLKLAEHCGFTFKQAIGIVNRSRKVSGNAELLYVFKKEASNESDCN